MLQIQSDVRVQYCFTKNHSAGIAYKIQYIPQTKGETFKKTIDKKGNYRTDTWIKESVNGGTERFIWSLGLNYSFSL